MKPEGSKAAHIAALLRDDPGPGQLADMDELTRGSSHPDAVRVQELLVDARQAATRAKRNYWASQAWTHAVLFNEYLIAQQVADAAIKPRSDGGNAGKVKKQEAAKRWQDAIKPDVVRLLKRGVPTGVIAERLAPDTALKADRKNNLKQIKRRSPRTVADFVRVVERELDAK